MSPECALGACLPPLPPSKCPKETRPSRVFMRAEGKPHACLLVGEAALLTASASLPRAKKKSESGTPRRRGPQRA